MIVYTNECDTRLTDYGILIPLQYNKAKKVYDTLCQTCMKDIPQEKWLYTPTNTLCKKETLLLAHTERYVNSLFSEDCEKEFFKTYELINEDGTYNRYDPSIATKPFSDLVRELRSTIQTGIEAAELSLKTGFAYFLGGGAHHAMPDYGAGFCKVNDIVIVARFLQQKNLVKNVWIIDVDAHKGDGTAVLTHNDNSIRTLSIHMAEGWPLDKNEYNENGEYNPSWTPNDIDIGLTQAEQRTYNTRLSSGLSEMEEKFEKPDLAIIVNGADPYEKDELDSSRFFNLTLDELLERDLLLYNFFKTRNIPQMHVMAGGYGEDSWEVYVNFLSKVLK